MQKDSLQRVVLMAWGGAFVLGRAVIASVALEHHRLAVLWCLASALSLMSMILLKIRMPFFACGVIGLIYASGVVPENPLMRMGCAAVLWLSNYYCMNLIINRHRSVISPIEQSVLVFVFGILWATSAPGNPSPMDDYLFVCIGEIGAMIAGVFFLIAATHLARKSLGQIY